MGPPSVKLEAGETILWTGKPDPLRMALKSWIVSLGGLVFVAVGFVALRQSGTDAVVLFVVGTGLLLAAAPYLKYREGIATTYAVTNRRLLIVIKNSMTESHPEVRKRDLRLVEGGGGRGDIFFARRNVFGSASLEQVGFVDIPDVGQVYRIIVDMVEKLDRLPKPEPGVPAPAAGAPPSGRPQVRWSGIVGEAPKEVTPELIAANYGEAGVTAAATVSYSPKVEAFGKALQRLEALQSQDSDSILSSPAVPQGVRAAAVWIGVGVRVYTGLPLFLIGSLFGIVFIVEWRAGKGTGFFVVAIVSLGFAAVGLKNLYAAWKGISTSLPAVPQGVRTAAVWIAAGVRVLFGLPLFFIGSLFGIPFIVALLTGKLAGDRTSVAFVIVFPALAALGLKLLHDAWKAISTQTVGK